MEAVINNTFPVRLESARYRSPKEFKFSYSDEWANIFEEYFVEDGQLFFRLVAKDQEEKIAKSTEKCLLVKADNQAFWGYFWGLISEFDMWSWDGFYSNNEDSENKLFWSIYIKDCFREKTIKGVNSYPPRQNHKDVWNIWRKLFSYAIDISEYACPYCSSLSLHAAPVKITQMVEDNGVSFEIKGFMCKDCSHVF